MAGGREAARLRAARCARRRRRRVHVGGDGRTARPPTPRTAAPPSRPTNERSRRPVTLDEASIEALATAIVAQTLPPDALLDYAAAGALLGVPATWVKAEARASVRTQDRLSQRQADQQAHEVGHPIAKKGGRGLRFFVLAAKRRLGDAAAHQRKGLAVRDPASCRLSVAVSSGPLGWRYLAAARPQSHVRRSRSPEREFAASTPTREEPDLGSLESSCVLLGERGFTLMTNETRWM